ncbi:unnamed protein product [Prunus brigantina]
MLTRLKTGTRKPNPRYALISFSQDLDREPHNFREANQSHSWRSAMNVEFQALQKASTWDLVPPSQATHILPCKWVYRIKRKSDGSLERFKARLVANGFLQKEGINYTETFCPVVKHVTIRIVLSLVVSQDWPIRQLDVQNAFLHGHLTEEVYMRQPKGFEDPSRPHHVCRLRKSLYGLKQAPRAWFHQFSEFLLQHGFVGSQADHSLFIYNSHGVYILLLIYVDDILITGNQSNKVQSLITSLSKAFAMKDLGPLSYFLGIEVTRMPTGLHLSQNKYTCDLLIRAHLQDSKPCATPVASGSQLSVMDGIPLSDPHEYRSVVGALQYLTVTRPDITYAVNQVCQHMHQPTTVHWIAVKRILRYLKGSSTDGLFFAQGNTTLVAYSDSDYAGNPDTRRSTGGFCMFLGPNLVSWSSKKQRTVARSSTESEYRQMAITATEIVWVQQLLLELSVSQHSPPVLWCDNISSIALASNPVFHSRTKHVAIDYHYVRELVIARALNVRYVSTTHQLADIFTKGLSFARFTFLKSKLIRSPLLSLREDDRRHNNSLRDTTDTTS